MVKGINWNDILKEAFANLTVNEELRKTVCQNILYLDDLSEEIDVPKDVLNAFATGKDIDEKSRFKIILWWANKEKGHTEDDESKNNLRLACFLAKLILYGTEEDLERLMKLADNLMKKRHK